MTPIDLFETARKVVRLLEAYSDELACEVDSEILSAAYEMESLRAAKGDPITPAPRHPANF